MSGCKNRLANHLCNQEKQSKSDNKQILVRQRNLHTFSYAEYQNQNSNTQLPFCLIHCRHVYGPFTPCEILPVIHNTIIMEKHNHKILWRKLQCNGRIQKSNISSWEHEEKMRVITFCTRRLTISFCLIPTASASKFIAGVVFFWHMQLCQRNGRKLIWQLVV